MFNYSNKLRFLKFCIDAFCIVICYLGSWMFSGGMKFLQPHLFHIFFPFLLCVCWYYSAKANNLYENIGGPLLVEIGKTLQNVLLQWIIIVIFLYYITDAPGYARLFCSSYLFLITVVLVLQKIIVRGLHMPKPREADKTNVLIVGSGKLGMNFYQYVNAHPALGYKVVGVLDDKPAPALNGHYLGKINQLQNIFNSDVNINEVVVALPNEKVKSVKHVISVSKNQAVRVRIMPDYSQFVSPGFTFENFGGMLVVNTRPEPLEAFHWRVVKRMFDIVFSLLVLTLLCSWLFPLTALIIKLNSKGPVFFKQLRSGKNMVPFYCYKFRSMYLNDEANLKKASKNDPRVTLVGKILRKSNIDELPQFFNVLIGDMSVVGPRPHMVSQNGMYSKIVSQYLVRQLVKPGVTGWAQVSGHRGEIKTTGDMQMRIEHDVWYLEHWSFLLDIKIIFRTVWNMLKGEENAY